MISHEYLPAFEVLQSYPLVAQILQALRDRGDQAYVIGGFIRDLYLGKGDFADIDLAVTCPQETLEALILPLFSSDEMGRNAFGYLRVKREDFELDIWPLESSWYFKTIEPYRGDPSHILESTFSSLDAIYYDVMTKTVVMSDGFQRAVKDKVLHYDLSKAYNVPKAMDKLLRQVAKYGIQSIKITV